jgi:hypothetical protein
MNLGKPTWIYIISHPEFNTCELFVYLQNCVLECVMNLERNETVYMNLSWIYKELKLFIVGDYRSTEQFIENISMEHY